MNIIEAIKSGKRFRRPGFPPGRFYSYYGNSKVMTFCPGTNGFEYCPDRDDIITEDWEIEEKIIELTRTKFYSAVSKCIKSLAIKNGTMFIHPDGIKNSPYDVDDFSGWADLAKELGLD